MENLLTVVWAETAKFRVFLKRREGRRAVEMMPRESIAGFSLIRGNEMERDEEDENK